MRLPPRPHCRRPPRVGANQPIVGGDDDIVGATSATGSGDRYSPRLSLFRMTHCRRRWRRDKIAAIATS
jgi:hypothetical protein